MAFDIKPPKIRLPRQYKKGDVVRVLIKMKHPSRTGLGQKEDGSFFRDKPPFYLKDMKAFYGDQLVTHFELVSSLSDDPILGFNLRLDKEAPLKVIFTNHLDQEFKVTKDVKFSRF